MGVVFAVLKPLGGGAALSVAAIGERLRERLPHFLVLIGIGAGLALLGGAGGFLPFALGAWLWEFSFTCGCVFQTAVMARSDPNGRTVVLVPAVFALSSMVGPGLAGKLLVDGGNFAPLLGAALISTLIPSMIHLARRPAMTPA